MRKFIAGVALVVLKALVVAVLGAVFGLDATDTIAVNNRLYCRK